jgi:hypothetical protein
MQNKANFPEIKVMITTGPKMGYTRNTWLMPWKKQSQFPRRASVVTPWIRSGAGTGACPYKPGVSTAPGALGRRPKRGHGPSQACAEPHGEN